MLSTELIDRQQDEGTFTRPAFLHSLRLKLGLAKSLIKPLSFISLLSVGLLNSGAVFAQDVPGCSDHPMMKRYADSEISGCEKRTFDEYALFIKPAIEHGGASNNGDAIRRIEGAIAQTTYRSPGEKSTLEVFRNYQNFLNGAGFEVLFICSSEECGGRNFNHAVVPYCCGFEDNYGEQRYLSAQMKRSEGDVFVSLYVTRNTGGGGPDHNRIFTQFDVIETKAMKTAMVVINAGKMAEDISETGHVALYGIYFDTNKASVRPESRPAIEEIAQLLNQNASLELVVVGHTDNQGALDYNMDLSDRRAKAVVDILVNDHGINQQRLLSRGAGFLSPVASNKSEAGRAKNRRVELVEQ